MKPTPSDPQVASCGPDYTVLRTQYFIVSQAANCQVPGYLILEPIDSVDCISRLSEGAQQELGLVQAECAAALTELLSLERIYFASFGEERRTFHCHIFPRTAAITEEFDRTNKIHDSTINGPIFLDWAREHYKGPAAASVQVMEVVESLRERFRVPR